MTLLETHINYLLKDVIQLEDTLLDQLNVKVNSGIINIASSSKSYTEPIFNFKLPEINKNDIKILDSIVEIIEKTEQNVHALPIISRTLANEEISFLKLIHFFINEHYFKNNLEYDSHERVKFNSVREEFRTYLKYPVADVMINALICKLDLPFENKKKLVFTCDYDIINIWDALGKFGSFKQLVKRVLYFNWITFFQEIYSVFLSHRRVAANYLLNTGMYYTELEEACKEIPKNIKVERNAFFLVSSTNKKYDVENNFDAKSFKDFLKILKKENVRFGIHPSYDTINSPELLSVQINKFRTIFKEEPELSRFHFLHCTYPFCLEILENHGIKKDYSFYFTENVTVFRSGTTRQFKMWNYSKERAFNVDILPITIMECSLDQYMNLDYSTALKLSKHKLLSALALGHNICLLWHNTQIYYGKTNRKNYQFKLFSELKKYIAALINE